MSGKKCSTITFRDETERKRQLVARKTESEQKFKRIVKAIESCLKETDKFILNQLPAENSSARTWVNEAANAQIQTVNMGSHTRAIEAEISKLNGLEQSGAKILRALDKAVSSQKKSAQADLGGKLRSLQAEFSARKEDFLKWKCDASFKADIDAVASHLKDGDYGYVSAEVGSIQKRIAMAVEHVEAEELKLELSELEKQLSSALRNAQYELGNGRSLMYEVPESIYPEFQQDVTRMSSSMALLELAINDAASINLSNPASVRKSIGNLQDCTNATTSTSSTFLESTVLAVRELKANLESSCTSANALFSTESDGIEKWFGMSKSNSINTTLESAAFELQQGNLRECEVKLTEINSEVQFLAEQVVERNDLHTRRRYVAKCLWEVVQKLGYRVEEPYLETQGDFNSRLVMKVDTVTKGVVTFYLSLRDLESDSCMSERFCLKDFDSISANLDQHFGIKTKFRMQDQSDPLKFSKDERPEPTAADLEL
jgi:hypothetical protein